MRVIAIMLVLLAGSIRASTAQEPSAAELPASGPVQDVSASAAVGPALIGADGDEFTQVFAAQALGWSGRGVRLCLIDDALDIYHPNFGACTGVNQPRYPTCRVYWGWNGGRDKDDNPGNRSDPTPKVAAQTHGTHVAGIMAGSFPAKLTDSNGKPLPYQRGVAFRSKIGIFKAMDDTDSPIGYSVQAVIAALRLASGKAKCRVVNMSFGVSREVPVNGLAAAVAALRAADVMPILSAGNSGRDRGPALFSMLQPANATEALAVAHLNNTASPGSLLQIDRAIPTASGERNTLVAIQRVDTPRSVCMPSCDNLKLPLKIFLLQTTPASQGCAPLDWVAKGGANTPTAAKGQVLLIQVARDCAAAVASSYTFWFNLPELKPALVLLALPSDEYALDSGEVSALKQLMPVMWLRSDDGLALAQAVAAADPAAPIKLVKVPGATTVDMPAAYARQPTDTSSMGPAADLSIKPDIAAPGTLYSSIPGNEYETWAGTSMASPYVAGVAGLWLESKLKASGFAPAGGWTQAAFTALQNTARPWAFPGSSLMWPPAKVGAGVVQAKNAILTTVGISPRQLNLRTDVAMQKLSFTLTNAGSAALTFKAVHRPAVGISLSRAWYKDAYDADAPTAEVSVTPDVVTVAAGGKASVMVTVITPEALRARDDVIFSGYITFTPTSGTPSADAKGQPFVSDPIPLSVPYQGSSRDYSSGGTSSLAVLPAADYGRDPIQAALAARGAYFCHDFSQLGFCKYTDDVSDVRAEDYHLIAMPLLRPMADFRIQVWSQDSGNLLGTTLSLGQLPAAAPLDRPLSVNWLGSYVPANATDQAKAVDLPAGQIVRLKLLLWPPVAVGDLAAGRKPESIQPFVIPVAGLVRRTVARRH